MDVETSEAIEGLSHRIEVLGADLRAEMAAQGEQLRADIRGVLVQVESVRDDIRIVAEGVASLAVKIDRGR